MTGAPFPKYDSCTDCNKVMYAPKRYGRCKDCAHEHTMQQVFGPEKQVQASLGEWA